MRIILLAIQYPPLNVGGSFRPQRIASGLVGLGVDVTVVTLNENALNREFQNPLNVEVDPKVSVIRTDIDPIGPFEGINNTYYFSLVDTFARRWKPHLLSVFERLHSENKPYDALMVTAPPFSMSKLGMQLAKIINVPLILDLRDAWSQWNIFPYATKVHYLLTKRLEFKMLKKAELVTITSPQTKADLLRIHRSLDPSKFHLLYNCFDAFFEEKQLSAHEDGPLKVGYIGSFYYDPVAREKQFSKWYRKKPWQYFQFVPRKEDWLYRSPYFFFRSLQALFEKRPGLKGKLIVNLIGNYPPWVSEMISTFDLHHTVKIGKPLTHEKVESFLMEQDYLLLTSSKVIDGSDYSIAGKTFEYLASGKPILAFVAEGAQKQLLEETKNAVICDPDDLDACQKKLEQLCTGKLEPSKESQASDFLCSSQLEIFQERLKRLTPE